jgi:hypothetical protein
LHVVTKFKNTALVHKERRHGTSMVPRSAPVLIKNTAPERARIIVSVLTPYYYWRGASTRE